MFTSTDGRDEETPTPLSGALSSRQITALIQQRKWWPFDRVDGKLLEKLHRQHIKTHKQPEEDALL